MTVEGLVQDLQGLVAQPSQILRRTLGKSRPAVMGGAQGRADRADGEKQIAVAEGRPLSFGQTDVSFTGQVRAHSAPRQVLARSEMPGAVWFPGATLNYAEHAVRARSASSVHVSSIGGRVWEWATTATSCGATSHGLGDVGQVGGDTVAGADPQAVQGRAYPGDFTGTESRYSRWCI
jgi:hypothetical protein